MTSQSNSSEMGSVSRNLEKLKQGETAEAQDALTTFTKQELLAPSLRHSFAYEAPQIALARARDMPTLQAKEYLLAYKQLRAGLTQQDHQDLTVVIAALDAVLQQQQGADASGSRGACSPEASEQQGDATVSLSQARQPATPTTQQGSEMFYAVHNATTRGVLQATAWEHVKPKVVG